MRKPGVVLVAWLLLFGTFIRAERLPIKTYTTADGLAHHQINRIVQDSRGFLWFCTEEGLSRFDGYTFTNYGIDQGLPSTAVNDLLETRSGVYWVATSKGLCRFNPTASSPLSETAASGGHKATPEPRFEVYRPSEGSAYILSLFEDRAGTVWCGTLTALYRLEPVHIKGRMTVRFVGVHLPTPPTGGVTQVREDRQGALWVGTGAGLYRRLRDGRLEHYTLQQGLPSNDIWALLEDTQGSLWVATHEGLCRMAAEPNRDRWAVVQVYSTKDGLAHNWVRPLLQSADGRLWIGSVGGLNALVPTGHKNDDYQIRRYTLVPELGSLSVNALGEDRSGNLWVGTEQAGVLKIARNGFTSFGEMDGLDSSWINSIFENPEGDLYMVTRQVMLNRFDGSRFTTIRPQLPEHITHFGWGWFQIAFQDHVGEWWIPTGQGLCRFPKVHRVEQLAHTPPKALYTSKNGMPGNEVFRLFEDARGDLWISTDRLTRWERATETFHPFTEIEEVRNSWATAYCEDRAGHLWMGFYGGGLARYRDGHFTVFAKPDGVPSSMVRSLHLDRAGRLWIAFYRDGVGCIDHPEADRPRLVTLTTAQGLSSNMVRCITEDQWGRIYLGTGRGVDRIDPTTGRIKHYTTADGLPGDVGEVAFCDRRGTLWFAIRGGPRVARLIPELDPPAPPAPILISGVRIRGDPYPISDLGEREVSGLALEANQNAVQIDFVGLGFAPGEALRYQYRLESTDRDWSELSLQRTVNYASLSPGTYHFEVRAVNTDGLASPMPAKITFTIRPPIWRRGWFLALAALGLGLLIYAFFQYRLRQLLALERVRTRIATDLHDGLGSTLSQIALLSELTQRQIGDVQPEPKEKLTKIAEMAREVVGKLSDTVWLVDPRRDHLHSLVLRLRQAAAEALAERAIRWDLEMHTACELERVRLTADQRHHLLLLFKEAFHNAVRHSGCAAIRLVLTVTPKELSAELSDDGRGFLVPPLAEPAHDDPPGNGLNNMRYRAAQLGGELRIESALGCGTRLRLRIPLTRALHRRGGKEENGERPSGARA